MTNMQRRPGAGASTALYAAFEAACELAGLGRDKGLRPHDLRHRFVVTRLAVWYREKADVQALLPMQLTTPLICQTDPKTSAKSGWSCSI